MTFVAVAGRKLSELKLQFLESSRVQNGFLQRVLLCIDLIIKENTLCVYTHRCLCIHTYWQLIMLLLFDSHASYSLPKSFEIYLFFKPSHIVPQYTPLIPPNDLQMNLRGLSYITLDWRSMRTHVKGKNTDPGFGIIGKGGKIHLEPRNF